MEYKLLFLLSLHLLKRAVIFFPVIFETFSLDAFNKVGVILSLEHKYQMCD